MKNILVPSDFSPQAQEAYRFAMEIAGTTNGVVTVLKVIDLPFLYETTFGMQPSWHNPVLERELVEEAKKNFEKMKDLHAEVPAPVSLSILRGAVAPTISQFIADNKIDLVIMGTQGASGIQGFFVGSNTEKIVRTSPVPVFAVRKAPRISAVHNIVLPSALELDHSGFMSKVKALQEFFHAKLHVLLINTPNIFFTDAEGKEALQKYARHYNLKDYTLNFRNDRYVEEGILNFMAEIKADMIAMATHGRRGLTHLAVGSIAEDVVNSISYPIWTYALKS